MNIFDNSPIYKSLGGNNFKYIRDKFNGLKAYITKKYIYILPFSFVKPDEDNYKGYPPEYNDLLYVFDWDGKGRVLDNIFIERLWRSVKYEYIYISRPENGRNLHHGLEDYFKHYNELRLHQSLDYKTPEEVYLAA